MADLDRNIIKTEVLNREGNNTMLEAVFRIVENNYYRKSAYTALINPLITRIEALERKKSILENYVFEVDGNGDLNITVPDAAYSTLSSELAIEDGVLYLNDPNNTSSTYESAVESYSLDVVNGDLILTI